jgi:hypothetical protein
MPISGYAAVALWFFGLMIFAGRSLNLLRVVLNNLKPGESYVGSAYVGAFGARFGMSATAVEPEKLNETGRRYQKKAILNQRLMFAWAVIGFVLIASYGSYLQSAAP